MKLAFILTPSVFSVKKVFVPVVMITIAATAADADAAVADLRITEVNPASGQVEVTNTSVTTFTVSANLPFSHKTGSASVIAAGTEFGAGQTRIFGVPGMDAADSDLWLYSDTNFGSASSIISGLKWGPAANVGNTAVAVDAGIWPAANAFVPAQTNASLTLRLTAYDSTVPANWAEGANNFGMFFGTGTKIDNPLPDVPKVATRIDLTPVATGLAAPVAVVQPDDGTDRLFICDQVGKIYIVLPNGTLLATPLLDISSRLVEFRPGFDERGLIGLAAHPNFATNKKIYTLSSEPKGAIPADFPSLEPSEGFNSQGVLAEWTIDAGNPNQVDVSTRRELFRVDEPQFNHNGGTLRFGPEGNLYIALGDGGNRDDEGPGHLPNGNAQDLGNPLGKILRIQIDGGPFPNGKYGVPADNPFVGQAGAIPEIWAYGLRNPYSFSFDRAGTNQLYVADVGQGEIEEIDILTAGANCGWRLKEGTFFFDHAGLETGGFVTTIPVLPLPPNLTEPIAQYDHDDGISIIGGFVYRGSTFPGLQGRYVFGDFGTSFGEPSGKLFFLNAAGEVNQFTIGSMDQNLDYYVKGFGEDQAGELYVCGTKDLGPSGTSGVVLKLVGTTAAEKWNLYE